MNIFTKLRGKQRPPDAEQLAEFKEFKQELALMPADSKVWNGLLNLLDRYVQTETIASVTPGMDDAEAHRFRGRIGMLLDLKSDLERLPEQARAEVKKQNAMPF